MITPEMRDSILSKLSKLFDETEFDQYFLHSDQLITDLRTVDKARQFFVGHSYLTKKTFQELNRLYKYNRSVDENY